MQPSYEEKKEKFSIIRKKPHHVPPHLHNAIELVYVTKGELELGVGCELYHMEQGDFASGISGSDPSLSGVLSWKK